MNTNRYLVLFFLFTIVNSCVEPYDSKVKKGRERIVVEGWITDQPGPYSVRLSKTSNYSFGYEGVNFGVKGAKVSISDDQGNVAEFKEDKYGYYRTDKEAIRGEVGRTYQLTIQIGEKVYQSVPETMLEVPPIDSLYYKYKEENDFRKEGFYVYVQTKDPAGVKNYYWWEWEGYTFRPICKFSSPEDPSNYGCCQPCWDIDRDSAGIYMNSDVRVDGNFIKDQEVARIPYSSRLFVSVKIEQYSLSEESFTYFSQLRDLSKTSGSVFGISPFQVKGNLVNVKDAEDALLGHFTISAIKWKWIDVDRSNIKKNPFPPPGPPIPKNTYKCYPCEETDLTTAIRPGY